MTKLFSLLVMLIIICVCALSAAAQESTEQLIDSLMAAYDAAPDDAAKLAVCRDVLTKYPESNYTVSLLGIAKDHSSELDAMDAFVDFAEEIRTRVANPETQQQIDRLLLDAYGAVKRIDKLNLLAQRITSDSKENFNLYYDLVKAYTAAEVWERAAEYAEKARPFATAEAYRIDYPKREMTDEELQERARNREGLIYTYAGWAKAHMGMLQPALEDFAAADARTKRMYMGHTYGELDYFWGRTLANAGKLDQALERLAAKTIFGEDEDARAAMREVFIERQGSEEQFDAYLDQERARLAKHIDDFSLETYSGGQLALSSLAGKVILLSFWFPT